jgi:MbtH protein
MRSNSEVRVERSADNQSLDGEVFVVLRNDEGQHSLWPAGKTAPDGWAVVHGAAPKADCLAFVEREWTDMRPRSLADR